MAEKKKLVRDMTPDEKAIHNAELKARQEADVIARRNHILPAMDREWDSFDVRTYLNMTQGTLYRLTSLGTGPAPLDDKRRGNYWWPPVVVAWREGQAGDWVDMSTFKAS